MDTIDQPPVDAVPAPPDTVNRVNGFRRTVLTAGMAAALLVAGGVAVVSAASPDLSATPTPVTTTDPSTGTSTSPSTSSSGQGTRVNCHDGTAGSPSATPTPTPAS